ncbi:carbon starvation CstA family protein [uncultured Fretibacterium sp.]|uniref:carbon starvation CstA family protein n=1 Tax=uncultured Fretibacterium sp. TaxID=1678694 RepID=UPI00263427EB|nr:carbon starvation CstA family protein [uncultured Fretibacterium sp.]
MITFFVALAVLIVGYYTYGLFVTLVFKPDDRRTPCQVHPDGVDYVPLPVWRAFLIQLLNIAGLGPIFGALSGAIWGPSVYLWIVLGTIFAGAVHDYLSGMLSMRNDGASVSELTGMYLGATMKTVMRIFSVVLLVMIGVVFMVGPAQLLSRMIMGAGRDFNLPRTAAVSIQAAPAVAAPKATAEKPAAAKAVKADEGKAPAEAKPAAVEEAKPEAPAEEAKLTPVEEVKPEAPAEEAKLTPIEEVKPEAPAAEAKPAAVEEAKPEAPAAEVKPAAEPEMVYGLTEAEWVKYLTIAILVYYFLATLLPIDKVIGRFYPLFGLCLLLMAALIGGATVMNHLNGTHPMIELWDGFYNMHPKGATTPIWPLMFITVACGAISGFHATQSPMMARCLTSERQGRFVFYGAMVAEGIIALIWASAGIAFYNTFGSPITTEGLFLAKGGNSATVYDISNGLLGSMGSILALLGVVACPITSGDTAFRSARLTLADWFKIDQKPLKPRLMLALPLLLIGYAISFVDYGIVWRYFSWSNQTLAMIALWAGAVYLCRNVSPISGFMAAIPATFMSAVSSTYFCFAPECLGFATKFSEGLSLCGVTVNGVQLSYGIGFVFALVLFSIFFGVYRSANYYKSLKKSA